MILEYLTIVLALPSRCFTLLLLNVTQKNYSLETRASWLAVAPSLALAITLRSVAAILPWIVGFQYRLLWNGTANRRKATYLAPHRSYNDRYYHYGIIHLL